MVLVVQIEEPQVFTRLEKIVLVLGVIAEEFRGRIGRELHVCRWSVGQSSVVYIVCHVVVRDRLHVAVWTSLRGGELI